MTRLTADHHRLVGSTPALAGLGEESLRSLCGAMEEVRIAPGENLVRQGDPADHLYVVLEGKLVAVLERGEEQPEQILREMGPGDLIGEVALITGGERTATVRALTPVLAAALSRQAFARLAESDAQTVNRLSETIASRLQRSQLAEHLGRLFGSMDLAALRDVENAVTWTTIESGGVLFRQGDPADAAYVVVSGRMRVTARDARGVEQPIGEVGRGETVGEIALLTHGARSATVYATRRSELARFSQDAFDRLTARYPSAMTHMTRLIGTRLQTMTLRGSGRTRVIDTVVIVPSSRRTVYIGEFSRQLCEAMSVWGPSVLIGSHEADSALGREGYSQILPHDPGNVRLTQWLQEQENDHRFVVYVADPEWSPWSMRATSQADHILVVANAGEDPAPGEIETRLAERWDENRAPRTSLVLLHASGQKEPRDTSKWLDRRELTSHFHIRLDSTPDVERLARILTGNAVSVVFGGGGARGFAHIGVMRALEEAGIPIDMVGGTSMGAIIAGNVAMGRDAASTLEGCKRYFTNLFDYTLPIVSVLAGSRITRNLEVGFASRDIEDLWIPFFCVSTNLTRAEPVVHRRGSLALAVRASISLPGVMPPVYQNGDLLVDGGLLNNVPGDVMRSLGNGGSLIAVDVTPGVDLTSSTPFEPGLSGWRVLGRKLNPFVSKVDVPHLVNLLNRSALIASVYTRNRMMSDRIADLYLQLSLSRWGMLEFDAIADIANAGYEQSIDRIREWRSGFATLEAGGAGQ